MRLNQSVTFTGLAQYFDCKSLLTASSWPNFWANPVTFTLRRGCDRGAAPRGRRGGQPSRGLGPASYDAVGVFGTKLPGKIGVFHSRSLNKHGAENTRAVGKPGRGLGAHAADVRRGVRPRAGRCGHPGRGRRRRRAGRQGRTRAHGGGPREGERCRAPWPTLRCLCPSH